MSGSRPAPPAADNSWHAAHVALFEHNIPAFENVAHLERLPARDFTVIALPAKIGGGSGGPLRIVALL